MGCIKRIVSIQQKVSAGLHLGQGEPSNRGWRGPRSVVQSARPDAEFQVAVNFSLIYPSMDSTAIRMVLVL